MIPKIIQASNDAGSQGLSISETLVMKAIAGVENLKGDATGILKDLLAKYGIKL